SPAFFELPRSPNPPRGLLEGRLSSVITLFGCAAFFSLSLRAWRATSPSDGLSWAYPGVEVISTQASRARKLIFLNTMASVRTNCPVRRWNLFWTCSRPNLGLAIDQSY